MALPCEILQLSRVLSSKVWMESSIRSLAADCLSGVPGSILMYIPERMLLRLLVLRFDLRSGFDWSSLKSRSRGAFSVVRERYEILFMSRFFELPSARKRMSSRFDFLILDLFEEL